MQNFQLNLYSRYAVLIALVWIGNFHSSCRTRGRNLQSVGKETGKIQLQTDEDTITPDITGRQRLIANSLAYPIANSATSLPITANPEIYSWKKGKLKRQQFHEYSFDEIINCSYRSPHLVKKPGGKTAKFSCDTESATGSGEKKTRRLKIKYDDDRSESINPGLYGEILATRIFRAIGFPSDTMFPVKVHCVGCPLDPWKHISSYWQLIEQSLSEMGKANSDEVKLAIRYIYQCLTRYENYSGATEKSKEGVRIINDKNGAAIFSSATGILRLPGGDDLLVFNPQNGRLTTNPNGSSKDYVIASALEGHSELKLASRDFASAAIEIKDNSLAIENFEHQGWSFGTKDGDNSQPDIRNISNSDPEIRIQREELALLAAFISHADNKSEQQRLICRDGDKIEAEDEDCEKVSTDSANSDCAPGTNVTFIDCRETYMMIQDLGFTFGLGARILPGTDAHGQIKYDSSPEARALGTASSEGIKSAPIFTADAGCTTKVNFWATGVNINESVSEVAKNRLVAKLKALSENETALRQIFRSARLHLKYAHENKLPFPPLALSAEESIAFVGTAIETQILNDWVSAFRERVAALDRHKCGDP